MPAEYGRGKEKFVSMLRIGMLSAVAIALAGGAATGSFAQDAAAEASCARLLPAIERLEAMLAQEARARAAESETQRLQVVMTLLGLRYRNIEGLESSLRSAETEETEIRSAMASVQAQLEALEEAARSSPPPPDAERRAQRSEIDAVSKGLEERAKGVRERKAMYQGQLAVERRDIERLEAVVRAWLEKTP
jgi:hypothetical protein